MIELESFRECLQDFQGLPWIENAIESSLKYFKGPGFVGLNMFMEAVFCRELIQLSMDWDEFQITGIIDGFHCWS